MVDFKKRLAKSKAENIIDPIVLYDTLDRESDKGPLRPVQKSVLTEWYDSFREKQDVILKLQTGQGKTLIGLLILQSRLNEGHGPAIYLCPNHFLVNQTCEQARQFGIPYCVAEGELPEDFLDGKTILITLVHKLFNGLTRFGLGKRSEEVNTIVVDDAHACIDAIRDSFIIRIDSNEQPYSQIRDMFAVDLENQGMGTFADIRNGEYGSLLPVPYWAWHDKHAEVASILSKYVKSDSVKYAWPLVRDMLDKCQCVVSGKALEIAPHLSPLHLFESYSRASHRVYMSATVADDSFLIKGLGLSPETIKNPLTYNKEKWSGEKMILIPSLIDESLDRASIVKLFARPKDGRGYGIVALVPSFKGTGDWQAYGATVATKETIDDEITKLREGDRNKTLVVAKVKRDAIYDGMFVLTTNTNQSAVSVVEAYKDLWQVELAFRQLKSELEMGPIYHWKDRRIRAHVMICFLAFVLRTVFYKKLKKKDRNVSYTAIMADVKALRTCEVSIKGEKIKLRTELEPGAVKAFWAIGMRPPSHLLSKVTLEGVVIRQ